MSHFSDNLVRLRKSRRWTQLDLAQQLQVSKSMISMLEVGEREPTNKTILKVAEIFGVTPESLLEESITYQTHMISNIVQLMSRPTANIEDMELILKYLNLPDDERKVLRKRLNF